MTSCHVPGITSYHLLQPVVSVKRPWTACGTAALRHYVARNKELDGIPPPQCFADGHGEVDPALAPVESNERLQADAHASAKLADCRSADAHAVEDEPAGLDVGEV